MRVQMHVCRHMHVEADTLGFVSVHACLHPLCVTACIHACAHTHASAPMWRFTGAHTFTRHGERARVSVSACVLMFARTRECVRAAIGAATMEADERLWQVQNAPGRLGGSWKVWSGGGRELWPGLDVRDPRSSPPSVCTSPPTCSAAGMGRFPEGCGKLQGATLMGGRGEGPTWGFWKGSVPS